MSSTFDMKIDLLVKMVPSIANLNEFVTVDLFRDIFIRGISEPLIKQTIIPITTGATISLSGMIGPCNAIVKNMEASTSVTFGYKSLSYNLTTAKSMTVAAGKTAIITDISQIYGLVFAAPVAAALVQIIAWSDT